MGLVISNCANFCSSSKFTGKVGVSGGLELGTLGAFARSSVSSLSISSFRISVAVAVDGVSDVAVAVDGVSDVAIDVDGVSDVAVANDGVS